MTPNVEVSGLRGFSRRSARLPGWATPPCLLLPCSMKQARRGRLETQTATAFRGDEPTPRRRQRKERMASARQRKAPRAQHREPTRPPGRAQGRDREPQTHAPEPPEHAQAQRQKKHSKTLHAEARNSSCWWRPTWRSPALRGFSRKVRVDRRVREHGGLGSICHEFRARDAGHWTSDRKPGPAFGFDISAMAATQPTGIWTGQLGVSLSFTT